MKILMLTCQYMPDVFGGAEKQCGRVSKGIQAENLDVQILTSRQKIAGKAKEVMNGVPVTRLYSPVGPDLLGRWLPFSIYWLFRVLIWAVFNKNSFDIIHCHQGKFGAFVGCCIARLLNKPVLIKVGNSNQFMDFKALKSKAVVGTVLAKFVLNTSPSVVAISDVIAKNCKEFGFKQIVNIPNSIDKSLLSKDYTKPKNVDSATINLFYHGRLEQIKKVDVLMESFALLASKNEQVHFHLIGSGSCLDNAKKYIAANNLQSRVTFYGEVQDPVNFIRQFDVFVNASEAEGFSNSLLEALLAGKVLVSTPVSGASDAIFREKNGYIASGFSAQEITKATELGIALHNLNKGEVEAFSEQLINTNFTVDVIAKEYVKLYKKLYGAS
ncbi:glycosyltransferase family 4 protein [Pseudoalteromonas sp. Angola-7]|uniref:glycosyltransferase family 4 protein n=1 Tax=Pseudoalteromonas sp. Angola-7 TaxID=3025336 RepID=UPI002359359E|nr:glycosyltransferase family 4 protein [Pseudoalteromonas sp. Angola-7]MDC9529388.1 glycosyltransferase family 4 protein [Pseudoalteromonas sp. Angola-7]